MSKKIRIIALYLPQYHPVKENDLYWGKGFTEWTNVAKAKPLFRGHEQPKIPADLGFYDLRLPQVREQQAEMAKRAGIEGFCYWHYWFGNGKEVLQMPFDEVVKSGTPDFPFCLGWALHDWTTKTWEKGKILNKDSIIFKQEFPGEEDDTNHFYRLLKAFQDPRYIKVDGKLLFTILVPLAMPNPSKFMKLWNKLAKENGLPGFHFVAVVDPIPQLNPQIVKNLEWNIKCYIDKFKEMGFDAVQTTNQKYAELKTKGIIRKVTSSIIRRLFPYIYLEKYDYLKIVKNYYSDIDRREDVYPQLLAGWDRSPRAGRRAIIYKHANPQNFGVAVDNVIDCVKHKAPEHRVVFLNSWNEWGEGAYMEPDLKYGTGKLEVLQRLIK